MFMLGCRAAELPDEVQRCVYAWLQSRRVVGRGAEAASGSVPAQRRRSSTLRSARGRGQPDPSGEDGHFFFVIYNLLFNLTNEHKRGSIDNQVKLLNQCKKTEL